MKTPATLTALDAAGMLYAVGMGWIKPKVIGETWADVYAGNVEYEVAGWKVTIFNDCDSWDYIDRIETPDGRFAEYGNWAQTVREFGGELDLPQAPDDILYLMNKDCAKRMYTAFINATP